MRNQVWALTPSRVIFGLAGGVLAVCAWQQAQDTGGVLALAPIQTTCVDDDATGYATFQSHNQKVLANARGIFMTYIRRRDEPYRAQQWRLLDRKSVV